MSLNFVTSDNHHSERDSLESSRRNSRQGAEPRDSITSVQSDVSRASDVSIPRSVREMDKEEVAALILKYSTLFPENHEECTYGEIAWHMTNHFIPLWEVESYSLEMSGMLGDLGLYIPIVVLLALNGQIDLGSTLITTGLCNILTGFVFKVPMCVQPMKSIASVALTEDLTEKEIMAAGISTSGIVMFLGATNLITVVDNIIPKPVVRGLQIGLGLGMFAKGLKMLPGEYDPQWNHDQWVDYDGYLVAAFTLMFCVMTARSKWFPTAFIVFIIGIVMASIRMSNKGGEFDFEIAEMRTTVPSQSDWITGLYRGALPQVPTTLLNSCIAVCKLSESLYPDRDTGLDLRSVSTSVGMMNVIFCWFGGYPMCHGSGGLAGQHRFGARTNLSIIVLGFSKLFCGIFLGSGLLSLLSYFPDGLLAALLGVASWELAVSGRSGLQGSIEDARLCVSTAALVTYWGQADGILMGLVLAYLTYASDCFFGSEKEIEAGRERFWRNYADFNIYMADCREWWLIKLRCKEGPMDLNDGLKEQSKMESMGYGNKYNKNDGQEDDGDDYTDEIDTTQVKTQI